ncbi:MAG: hypothetical protein Q7O66_16645 [Dehalococcoidia bacterium]|nr:hypothetical protein [Dehalococcoidia bacterium]
MSTTLLQLERNIAKAGYGYATGAPSSTGLVTTIIDSSADSPLDTGDSSNLYVNAWAKIEADSAGSPQNVGEIGRVSTYSPSTYTLTVGRAFSNTTKTTMTYGLYMGLPPSTQGLYRGIADYLNDTLRRLFYRRPFLLTLVTDGDMEASGVANWTGSGIDISLSIKSTSTGVTLGDQALRVKNSSANGYFQSATVNVEETQSYLLVADVTVASGTAVLELYDVTNSASIETATCDQRQTRRIWLTANIPADCMQVAVRLKGTEDSADIYWDNITLLNQAMTEIALPSWFKNEKWLERVSFWRYRGSSHSGQHAAVDSLERCSPIWHNVLEDPTGYTPYKVMMNSYPIVGAHLVGQALCPYTELSADADATDADPDWVLAWTLAQIGMDKKDEDMVKRWMPEAKRLDRQFMPVWDGKRFAFGRPF